MQQQSLTFSISVLMLAIVGHAIISIIQTSAVFNSGVFHTVGSMVFASYFASFFHAVIFIAIIIIAKDSAWTSSTSAANTFPQQRANDYHETHPEHRSLGQYA